MESLDVNDSSGTKGRVALLKNMAAAGFEVTALHYTQKEISLPGIRTVMVKEGKGTFYFLSRLQQYIYKWFRYNIGTRYEKRTGFSFNWRGAKNAFAKALKKYDPSDFDMLWTLGKGTNFRAHAGVLKCIEWHPKWYAYIHDPYPQQLYPRPYNFVPYGYRKKWFFLRDVTQLAHKVIFPSDLLRDWMQSYFAEIQNKAVIIPHQITDMPYSKSGLPDYFDMTGFTILHAGNLLDLRDPSPLVKAFCQFIAKQPQSNAQLLFIGKAGKFQESLKLAADRHKQIYVSKGYVSFEEVYHMQLTASVNVILEAKAEISPFLPGKFAHCIVANNPIVLIGPYYSESKRLLGKEYPYAFEFSEVNELEQAITQLYLDWENGELAPLNRDDLRHYLSKAYLEEKLTALC